ncbi:olfactory receptor 6C3-like [Tachyglossus aculeatus]|uniref:olfactory receptor 6C3-like n=1 Tax=Tachyglossus aculeatus TaxID=9261 RepID=UPI0018F33FCD|nr:olfactory receptor 6C3-like [Tachyglossus aculeatus]
MALVLAVGTLLFTLILVTPSYMAIARVILRLPSTQQRRMALSTYSSHIVVISNIYGSCIVMYIKPSAGKRVELTTGVAVLSMSLAPMLNPFIYTLWNQQVSQAFQGMVHQVEFSSRRNHRSVMRNHTGFILLGLMDNSHLLVVILLHTSVTYTMSVTGNLTIITLNLLESRLHTPMYFFLHSFLLLEICFTFASIPRFLATIATKDRTISYNCLLITLVLVVISYTTLARAILRLPSSQQKRTAFSTSFSHMVVVSITYGSCNFMYIKPSAKDMVDLQKGVAVLNTSVALILNPFIYTLQNEQVKQSNRDLVHRVGFSSRRSPCYFSPLPSSTRGESSLSTPQDKDVPTFAQRVYAKTNRNPKV